MKSDREDHHNNFGLLRLVFALLVVVAHSFELADGDRAREPLWRIFGTMTFGEFGVSGFFLISGFLITKSFENSRSIGFYVWKRVLRIYPAFVVASIITLLFVAPLAGVDLKTVSLIDWVKSVGRIVFLQPPWLPGTFIEQPTGLLNGAMWTIAYEFRCYLVVILIGQFGFIFHRRYLLALTIACWAFYLVHPDTVNAYEFAVGQFGHTARLTGFFLTGATFYAFRDLVDFTNRRFFALATLLAFLSLTYSALAANIGFAVFGGYMIFWLAFSPSLRFLNEVNAKTDLSYGCYLYAWPIQMLCARYIPGVSHVSVIAITSATSLLLALASYKFIEKPALRWKAEPMFLRPTGWR